MLRTVTLLFFLGASVSPALAQTGQFPGVAPSVPSPGQTQLGGAPLPPAVMPGPVLPNNFHAPSRVITTRHGRNVLVPSGPPDRQNFSDRVERCIEAGTAAGVGPNHIGSFTRRCAN
jgi:hypothetical protein